MAKKGQNSVYTQAIADAICARLAKGESLRKICKDAGMPDRHTVAAWAVDNVRGFYAQYARARDFGYDALAEEALEIADTPVEGVRREESEQGVKEVREDMTAHRRLQVDTRKWYLSKVAPKKYGDKQTVDLNVTGSLADRLARARKREA